MIRLLQKIKAHGSMISDDQGEIVKIMHIASSNETNPQFISIALDGNIKIWDY
jgi:hypothetical protein